MRAVAEALFQQRHLLRRERRHHPSRILPCAGTRLSRARSGRRSSAASLPRGLAGPEVGGRGLQGHQHEIRGADRQLGVGAGVRRRVEHHDVLVPPQPVERRRHAPAGGVVEEQRRGAPVALRGAARSACQRVTEPCGSVSSSATRRPPSAASTAARLAATVDLPDPPFCCATATTNAIRAPPRPAARLEHGRTGRNRPPPAVQARGPLRSAGQRRSAGRAASPDGARRVAEGGVLLGSDGADRAGRPSGPRRWSAAACAPPIRSPRAGGRADGARRRPAGVVALQEQHQRGDHREHGDDEVEGLALHRSDRKGLAFVSARGGSRFAARVAERRRVCGEPCAEARP